MADQAAYRVDRLGCGVVLLFLMAGFFFMACLVTFVFLLAFFTQAYDVELFLEVDWYLFRYIAFLASTAALCSFTKYSTLKVCRTGRDSSSNETK